jgi:hypothetical protein
MLRWSMYCTIGEVNKMKIFKQVRAYIRRLGGRHQVVRKHKQRYSLRQPKRMIGKADLKQVFKISKQELNEIKPKIHTYINDEGKYHDIIVVDKKLSHAQLNYDINRFPQGTVMQRFPYDNKRDVLAIQQPTNITVDNYMKTPVDKWFKGAHMSKVFEDRMARQDELNKRIPRFKKSKKQRVW